MPEASVDYVVSDPPYGLEFMGAAWDRLGGMVLQDPSIVGGFQDGQGGNPYSRSRVRYGTFKGQGGVSATSGGRMQDWHRGWLAEAFRVLKPGGVIKAFSGSRTCHRLAAAMEDVGFVIVDLEAWSYGSGFPKSLDVSKAIDKMAGAVREMKRTPHTGEAMMRHGGDNTRPWIEEALKKGYHEAPGDTPVSSDAVAWDGWGTALKPAWEPVVVGRKPE